MGADEEGDAVMGDAAEKAVPSSSDVSMAGESTEAKGDKSEDASAEPATPAEPEGPPPEERVTTAEVAKEAGNALLKSGDFEGAVSKYAEGIGMAEPVHQKKPETVDEELQKRATVVYIALCLNAAQACIKQSKWGDAAEYADRVLAIEKENPKALFRRGVASMTFDSESRLEQARGDLARFVQLEPSNREARERLQQVKDRLKEVKQREKERYSKAMTGSLYQDNHKKLDRQKLEYEEEVKRREDAGEDAITWEDWQKKLKDKEEADKKKEKEDREERAKKVQEEEEQRLLEDDNRRLRESGLEEMTLEEWRATQEKARREGKEQEVVKTDELDLDEEDKKLLEETKAKGYYHGRLGTVRSDEAPKPQQVSREEASSPDGTANRGSEWNQAGTWEERDSTAWVKERLTAWLGLAAVAANNVTLSAGQEVSVSAEVSKVKKLEGDAQIVTVRKQPRFGYNFEAEISFKIHVKPQDEEMPAPSEDGEEAKPAAKAPSQKFDGTLSIPELADAVPPQELKVDATWKTRSPPEHLQATVLECLQQLKTSVREQVSGFLSEYKAKTL